MALGESAADRNNGATEIFRAVVEAETTGEQPVAIGDVHFVARPPAAGSNRARHQPGPETDVAARIADHSRFSGCAARSVDANDIAHRHGKHAERIVLTKILLCGERQARKIA